MTLTPLQLELTKLLGNKELTFGCLVKLKQHRIYCWQIPYERIVTYIWEPIEYLYELKRSSVIFAPEFIREYDYELKEEIDSYEIIWAKATLTDFHKWLNEEQLHYVQDALEIQIEWRYGENNDYIRVPYDSSKSLLEQEESTLEQIKTLITNNS